MEQVKRAVELHFQYVRVACDEQLGRRGKECGTYARVVVAGITAYMSHQHVHILTLPSQPFGEHPTEVTAIAVATDSPQRPEGGKSLGHLSRSDVAGMPYLVAGLEVVQVLFVPIGVGIAEYSDFFHSFLLSKRQVWLVYLAPFVFLMNSAMNSIEPSMPRRDVFTQRSYVSACPHFLPV